MESMAAGHSSTGNENSGTQLIKFSSDDRWFMDGDIFFAFTGAHFDARTLIPELKNKAKLIITEKEATGSNVIYRPDARQIYKKFIKAGAKVYPLHVLGITGTKGKSTIAWWLSSLLGFGYMGTLGITAKDVKFVLPTTTTGADALFNTYRRTGEDHWVVELSSIGLAEDRLPLPLEGLVWTTFEPEHMDYHKTTYAYYLAKKKAFSYLKKGTFALLGQNVPQADIGTPYLTLRYGDTGDFYILDRREYEWEQEVKIYTPQGSSVVHIPMPGKVFAHDAVGTVAAAFLWKGIKLEGEFPSVPVRMNHVIINGIEMVIDFAHTPESIDACLQTVAQRWGNDFVVIHGATGYEPQNKSYEIIKVINRYGIPGAASIIKSLDQCQSEETLRRYENAGFITGSSTEVFQLCSKKFKKWVIVGMRDAYDRLKEAGIYGT
ncbi:MAG: Mur ligase family protein [Coprothermobacter proteolyticus]